MNKKCFWVIFFLVLSAFVSAQRVAVSSFHVSGHDSPAVIEQIIVDSFVTALSSIPDIQVLDRRNLAQVLEEQELALSGLVDSDTIINTGELLGSTALITGSCIIMESEGFFSARCIDNISGEVLHAYSSPIRGSIISAIGEQVSAMLSTMVFEDGEIRSGDGAAVWYAQGGNGLAGGEDPQRSILIYVMSTEEDSVDEYGQWYLGPQQIQAVTQTLREEGFSVQIHDRNTLAGLTETELDQFTQVWLLEGDANPEVNTAEDEINQLLAFFNHGGSVWLSAENIVDPVDNCWVEDINAYSQQFGYRISGNIATIGPLQRVENQDHPVLQGVHTMVFDFELGYIEFWNKDLEIVHALNSDARQLGPGWQYEMLLQYADYDRYMQAYYGEVEIWTFGWIMGDNFSSVGPEIGESQPGILSLDRIAQGGGRMVGDCGWALGWAFTTDVNPAYADNDNLQLVRNIANWLEYE
ncbi:MAG: CsgG/HfaB family protein [Spirochaetia bacterium]